MSFLFESVSFGLSSEVSGTSLNALSSNSSSTKKKNKKNRQIVVLMSGYFVHRELEQMEPILNFQVPAESLELVILLHTQY